MVQTSVIGFAKESSSSEELTKPSEAILASPPRKDGSVELLVAKGREDEQTSQTSMIAFAKTITSSYELTELSEASLCSSRTSSEPLELSEVRGEGRVGENQTSMIKLKRAILELSGAHSDFRSSFELL